MKPMIEMLESRTLLSAAPVAAPFAVMQTAMSVVSPGTVYTSPVGTYPGTFSNSGGSGAFTFVIRQWNTTAGTMSFKLVDEGGRIHKGVGTIVGRRFTFQFPSNGGTWITTITGKLVVSYASATGTYVDRNLRGVQKDSGTFSVSRQG